MPNSTMQSGRKRRVRVPKPEDIKRLRETVGDEFDLPPAYPEQLAEFVGVYRQTDKTLPRTDYAKLNTRPKDDNFQMFPSKYSRAITYASAEAKLVFWALWDQHLARHCRANGLLEASIDYLIPKTGIGSRQKIADAQLELEVRGIVRIMRGRGGRTRALPNLFLLTAFPDCLGNSATRDYERHGFPLDKPMANSDEARALEADQIAARFNNRISDEMALVRFARKSTRGRAS